MRNLRLLIACTAIFTFGFVASCGDDAKETNCTDQIDNDGDGVADCADSDCDGNQACQSGCNNNNLCEPAAGENATNCPNDCGSAPVCGNGTCETGEDSTNCLQDCPVNPCNNDGNCDAGETTANCPADCSGGDECDGPDALVDQVGCSTGEMCTIVDQAGTVGCGPVGIVADYAECSATIGDCLAGAFCGADGATGMCMPYCDLEGGTCPGGGVCSFSFATTNGNVGLCAPPDTCDLVDSTGCESGEGCYFASQAFDTICVTAGTTAIGGACVYTNDCVAGAGCSSSVCVQWCKGDGDCDAGTCQNIGSVSSAHADLGVCQP